MTSHRLALVFLAAARTRGPYACNCVEDVPAPPRFASTDSRAPLDPDGGGGGVETDAAPVPSLDASRSPPDAAIPSDAGRDAGPTPDATTGDAATPPPDAQLPDASPPDPCARVVCDPPPPACEGSTLRVFTSGRCDDGECVYGLVDVPCAWGCDAGACLGDPCAGVVCDAPPAPTCDGDAVRTFGEVGSCVGGACVYPSTDGPPCALGCAEGACVAGCGDGVCEGGEACTNCVADCGRCTCPVGPDGSYGGVCSGAPPPMYCPAAAIGGTTGCGGMEWCFPCNLP